MAYRAEQVCTMWLLNVILVCNSPPYYLFPSLFIQSNDQMETTAQPVPQPTDTDNSLPLPIPAEDPPPNQPPPVIPPPLPSILPQPPPPPLPLPGPDILQPPALSSPATNSRQEHYARGWTCMK